MPTYDYVCDACDHKFELFQSMKDEALRKCPKCKKAKLRRLFGTGAAIMFKGSGFYTTDYRSESYKKAAKADSDSSGNGESKSPKSDEGGSSKSESKASDTRSSDTQSRENTSRENTSSENRSSEPKSSESKSKSKTPKK